MPNVVQLCQSPSDGLAVSQGLHPPTCSLVSAFVLSWTSVSDSASAYLGYPVEAFGPSSALSKSRSSVFGPNSGSVEYCFVHADVEEGKDCCAIAGSFPSVMSLGLGLQSPELWNLVGLGAGHSCGHRFVPNAGLSPKFTYDAAQLTKRQNPLYTGGGDRYKFRLEPNEYRGLIMGWNQIVMCFRPHVFESWGLK